MHGAVLVSRYLCADISSILGEHQGGNKVENKAREEEGAVECDATPSAAIATAAAPTSRLHRFLQQEHQPVANNDAAAFFFQDQAQHNDAQHAQVDEQRVLTPQDMPRLPPDCFKALVVGQQAVAKGQQGSSALNKVQVVEGVPCIGWGRSRGGRSGTLHHRAALGGALHCLARSCLGAAASAAASAIPLLQIILCCVRLPQHGSDLLITLNSPIFISEKSAAAQHAGMWTPLVQMPCPPAHCTRPSAELPCVMQVRASRARTSWRRCSSSRSSPRFESTTGGCLAADQHRSRRGPATRHTAGRSPLRSWVDCFAAVLLKVGFP